MNELKPEDVMRALEICGDETQTCYNCPYTDHCNDAHKDALALLREKDAEIERLSKMLDDFPNCKISGCEAARKDCHIDCPYGKENNNENS